MFYHDAIDGQLNEWNLIAPCTEMLQIALRLDRVHTFGNISPSQLYERMDWVTEMAIIND